MRYTYFLIAFIIISCSDRVKFNQELVDELATLAEVDQTAAWIPQGKFKEYSQQEWLEYKDSVFRTHKLRAEEIFDDYGYPGFDLVGDKGSNNYWLLVQHCDFDPAFQQRVLEGMKTQMEKGNADKKSYAYLVDRVNVNLNKEIVYGTQVTYNRFGQAVPKNLADSANVNERRANVGLEPLEVYLNQMTKSHFEMNKENFLSIGRTEPLLYPVSEE